MQCIFTRIRASIQNLISCNNLHEIITDVILFYFIFILFLNPEPFTQQIPPSREENARYTWEEDRIAF